MTTKPSSASRLLTIPRAAPPFGSKGEGRIVSVPRQVPTSAFSFSCASVSSGTWIMRRVYRRLGRRRPGRGQSIGIESRLRDVGGGAALGGLRCVILFVVRRQQQHDHHAARGAQDT